MKTLLTSLPCLALLACSSSEPSKDIQVTQVSKEGTTPHRVRGEGAGIKVTVLVEAVDMEKREMKLKGPEGNWAVFKVAPEVKRLNEIKPGDKITADYQIAALIELRAPTDAEKAAPITITEGEMKSLPGTAPQASMARSLKVVTTIHSLDAKKKALTLKGPLGGEVTAPVENPATFEALKVGQTIVVLFAESLTLTVEPKK